jgi:hypothetical protein
MGNTTVFGEDLRELTTELLGMDFRRRPDGSGLVRFDVAADSSFLRALDRAEVELLLSGNQRAQRAETRRYDAFLMLVERVGEAARSSST